MPPRIALHLVVLTATVLPVLPVAAQPANVVEVDLTVAAKVLEIDGTRAEAMTINGGIPAPTLVFREGALARIHVHNELDTGTSIHWHGLLVPNLMDGVPYVTQPQIAPGTTFTYELPIRQTGTYWYHSHTRLQEQQGMYGTIVILPAEGGPTPAADRDHAVLFSDWTTEDPEKILRLLRSGNHWYSIAKGSAQSIVGAARLGLLGDYFSRELQRMPAMDIADIAYDRFLANGTPETALEASPGETVRVRIVDGSASTFFHLEFAGGPMTVVAADGQDVEPFAVDRLLITVAETYDVLLTIPGPGAWELRATAHDGASWASAWLGDGERHPAPDVPRPNLYPAMGELSWKRVLAWTPAGAMGMSDAAVAAGDFDAPGMHMMDMEGHEGMGGHGEMGTGGHGAMDMGDDAAPPKAEDPNAGHGDQPPPDPHAGHDEPETPGHGAMDMGDEAAPPEVEDPHAGHGGQPPPDPHAGHATAPPAEPGEHAGHATAAAPEHDGGVADAASRDATARYRRPPSGKRFGDDYALLAADVSSSPALAVDGMDPARPLPPYDRLRARRPTAFGDGHPVREIRLTLDGDMDRFVWFINEKALSEEDTILIREGEVVRFVMINRTMMHHPMHLHGHFFRVVNEQGAYSPLKHTVDVVPMGTTVIEFLADERGDWFFHCHLLFHMETGMARVVHYESWQPPPAVAAVRPQLSRDHWATWAVADAVSSMSEGVVRTSGVRNIVSAAWEVGWSGVDATEWETELTYDRYLNRFLTVFGGALLEGVEGELEETRAIVGARYLLPFNVASTLWLDSDGGGRIGLEKHFELTPRLLLGTELQYDSHEEWEEAASLSWLFNRDLALVVRWHSEYGTGAGVRVLF